MPCQDVVFLARKIEAPGMTLGIKHGNKLNLTVCKEHNNIVERQIFGKFATFLARSGLGEEFSKSEK
jgi:hypothetical protein